MLPMLAFGGICGGTTAPTPTEIMDVDEEVWRHNGEAPLPSKQTNKIKADSWPKNLNFPELFNVNIKTNFTQK